MKFNFKKIASIIATTVMLGSTVAFAAAAWPAPFVNNGAADAAVVYGSASADYVAAADLGATLDKSVTAGAVNISGENVKIERSTDKLNLGDGLASTFVTSINKDQLPTMLADGTYLDTNNNEFKYTQKVELGSTLALTDFRDTDLSTTPTIGVKVASGANVLNYTLDFTTNPNYNDDLKNTDLPILGKNYYVLSVATDKLTLLDSAESTTLKEGESKDITVNGKAYKVAINFVGNDQIKLDVNGEVTKQMSSSAPTYKLSDGTYVGIKEINYNSKDSGVSSVDFSLGNGKLVLSSGNEVELNDDTISGLTATMTNTSGKLDKIVLKWNTDDKMFITPTTDLVMPGFGSIKLSTTGFTFPKQEVTTLEADGSDSIKLVAPIKSGSADFNLIYATSGVITGLGKDSSNKLITSSDANSLVYNESDGAKWFVVSWNSSSEAESYLLSAKVTTKDNANRTTIKDEVTGSNICEDVANGSTCTVGNVVLNVASTYRYGDSKWVNFSTSTTGASFQDFYTAEGLKIELPYLVANTTGTVTSALKGSIDLSTANNLAANTSIGHNNASFYVFAQGEDKDANIAAGPAFNLTLKANTDSNMHVSADNAGAYTDLRLGDSDKYESIVKADVPTKIVLDKTGNEYTAELTYAGSQAYGDVYLAAKSAVTGITGSTKVVKDTEITSVQDKNLIVVGGSCINTVAAQILGSTTPLCGAAFADKTGAGVGKYLIQVAASPVNSQKIAMLVAGYEAADTTNAVAKVKEGKESTSVGKVVYPLASA